MTKHYFTHVGRDIQGDGTRVLHSTSQCGHRHPDKAEARLCLIDFPDWDSRQVIRVFISHPATKPSRFPEVIRAQTGMVRYLDQTTKEVLREEALPLIAARMKAQNFNRKAVQNDLGMIAVVEPQLAF